MFIFSVHLFRTSTPIHIQNEESLLNQKALEKYIYRWIPGISKHLFPIN
jgi:hypothetical protein